MRNGPVVEVEGLSKKFCRRLKRSLWYGVCDLANEVLARRGRRHELRKHEFWALRDVSFELHRGETLGVIGQNGAGKTTLLRLLNGLIKPDTGRIRLCGRVGALIQLGAGFSPILTGRENIYINGAVLGLGKKEIDHRLDEIIDFAEIGDFIDAPVQTYSSGMKVRLGFSIASHMQPDLLLIDEILAVGDSSFRERCYRRFNDFKCAGGTIVYVSHNTMSVEAVSDRVMLLDHGQVSDIGDPAEIVQSYEERSLQLSREAEERLAGRGSARAAGDIRLSEVTCHDAAGRPKDEIEFGASFELRVGYEFARDFVKPYFVIGIQKGSAQNSYASMMAMIWDGIELETFPRRGVVGCAIRDPRFSPGLYRVHVGVLSQATGRLGEKWYLPMRECGSFTVLPGPLRDRFPGAPAAHLVSRMPPMMVEHTWSLDGRELAGEPRRASEPRAGRRLGAPRAGLRARFGTGAAHEPP